MRTLLIVVLAIGAVSCGGGDGADVPPVAVSSPAFDEGIDIPTRHTCDGEDVPPPLTWEAAPPQAVELVIVVDDPDAPGGTFVHWLVAGLSPDVMSLDGPLPGAAVEGRNGADAVGWSGPCPPAGDDPHTYRFRLLAVDQTTGLTAGFTAEELQPAMAGRLVAEGVLTGRYGR